MQVMKNVNYTTTLFGGTTPPFPLLPFMINWAAAQLSEGAIFGGLVMPHGAWDFKTAGAQYDFAGNFNFGAAGAAGGYSSGTLLRAAGVVQVLQGRSSPSFGHPWDAGPNSNYGDDPTGQMETKQGIAYAKNCGG